MKKRCPKKVKFVQLSIQNTPEMLANENVRKNDENLIRKFMLVLVLLYR